MVNTKGKVGYPGFRHFLRLGLLCSSALLLIFVLIGLLTALFVGDERRVIAAHGVIGLAAFFQLYFFVFYLIFSRRIGYKMELREILRAVVGLFVIFVMGSSIRIWPSHWAEWMMRVILIGYLSILEVSSQLVKKRLVLSMVEGLRDENMETRRSN